VREGRLWGEEDDPADHDARMLPREAGLWEMDRYAIPVNKGDPRTPGGTSGPSAENETQSRLADAFNKQKKNSKSFAVDFRMDSGIRGGTGEAVSIVDGIGQNKQPLGSKREKAPIMLHHYEISSTQKKRAGGGGVLDR